MPFQTGFFIVKPTNKLLMLADKYTQNDWKESHIWTIPEISDYVENRENYYVNYVKIAFLAEIIQKFELPAIRKPHPNYAKVVHEIFGTPPRFTITALNDWWNFERADTSKDFAYVIRQTSVSILKQIQKTGNKEIDDWLQVNIENFDHL